MSKDPAVLLYTADFLIGTAFMTLEETGLYIKLLCLQQQTGGELSEAEIVKKYPRDLWEKIKPKFTEKRPGIYQNKRMKNEMDRRDNYCKSRKFNRLSKKHMKNHMSEHMEDVNVIENKDEIELRGSCISGGGQGGVILPGYEAQPLSWAFVQKIAEALGGGTAGKHEAGKIIFRAWKAKPKNLAGWISKGLQKGYARNACTAEENGSRELQAFIDKYITSISKEAGEKNAGNTGSDIIHGLASAFSLPDTASDRGGGELG